MCRIAISVPLEVETTDFVFAIALHASKQNKQWRIKPTGAFQKTIGKKRSVQAEPQRPRPVWVAANSKPPRSFSIPCPPVPHHLPRYVLHDGRSDGLAEVQDDAELRPHPADDPLVLDRVRAAPALLEGRPTHRLLAVLLRGRRRGTRKYWGLGFRRNVWTFWMSIWMQG